MKEMMKYLLESAKAGNIDKNMAARIVMALSKKESEASEYAIVGMNGEFAMSENLEEYRQILKNGIDCVGDFPKKRQAYARKYLEYIGQNSDVKFVKGGFLESIWEFDPAFFGISPAEAKLMDPNQRRFLQAAWNCLEDAGYGAGSLNGKNVGVFVGYDNSSVNEYRKLVSDVEPESVTLAMTGNIIPVIASRISYICDYRGPSSIFDTACSSSAAALYFALLAIESGECESAIVGSTRICMFPAMMEVKLGVEANNWKAKAFDDAADGTGVGEGVGAIYVKKLQDALRDKDDIYCVIKGVTANSDGDSTGITAPNPTAQARLIAANLKKARVPAESITYFEAHGTGTRLGDPIEIEGIQKAFTSQTNKKQFCAIGSSKTNLGHLDHASTMASIIKCAMSLKYKELYPSLHYHVPNRLIDFTDSPVYIVAEYQPWKSENAAPRRCAINAFGLSGTNVNIILEEAPKPVRIENSIKECAEGKSLAVDKNCDQEKGDGNQKFCGGRSLAEDNGCRNYANKAGRILPLTLSAKSWGSYISRIDLMINYLENNIEDSFADICYTAAQNEGYYHYACFLQASSKREAAELLAKLKEDAYVTESPRCISSNKEKENTQSESLHTWIMEIEDDELKSYADAFFCGEKKNFDFGEVRRVHLPVYPFEKKKCLLEIPEIEVLADESSFDENDENAANAGNRVKKSAQMARRVRKEKKVAILGNVSGLAPDTAQEMAQIWCKVLGTETVRPEDNFYELGGDSIFAMKFAAEVKERLHVNLSIKDVLANPTFYGITAFVDITRKKEPAANESVFTVHKHDNVTEYEMTNSQKEMYAMQRVNPDSTAYNMFCAVKVLGDFDTERFTSCVNQVIKAQDALRTSFLEENGKFLARVRDEAVINPEYFEEDDIKTCAGKFIRSFDLEKDLLVRLGFAKLHKMESAVASGVPETEVENETIILLDIHHIVCDGMSTGVLIHQICQAYAGSFTRHSDICYSDYAISVNEFEKSSSYQEIEDKLIERLSGVEVLKLPTDFKRGRQKSFAGRKCSVDLSLLESERVRSFTRENGLTAFQFFLSMFQVLLSRYSGQTDIVIGTPVSGRADVRLQELAGLFVNTVVLRRRIDEKKSCLEELLQVRNEVMESYEAQCVSFPSLLDKMEISYSSAGNPLFDVMFSMQNFDHAPMALDGIEVSVLPIANEVSKLDITMNISEHDEIFNLEIEYATALFKEDTILRMLVNYKSFLLACMDAPDIALSDLPLSEEERRKLELLEKNEISYNSADTIKACIERRAIEHAGENAVVFAYKKGRGEERLEINSEILSYEELNRRANFLAELLREKGLEAGNSRVAILCRRSPEMMIAVLAAVKAGIAYLPLDPDYPAERLRYILKDSQTACVIHYKTEKIWDEDVDVQSISLDDLTWEKREDLPNDFTSDVAMYMIYTSGSTGLPKGVSITQKNVRNFILGMNKSIPFGKGQRMLSVTTIGFDIFVLESFLAMVDGMEIIVAGEDVINDMDALCTLIMEKEIDILQTTPSRIRAMMISPLFPQAMCQLKFLLVGGEPFPKDFLEKFLAYPVRLFNVYGPTETTVWSTISELTGCSEVHVGRPIANTRCVVVSTGEGERKRVPMGVVGELAIGGDGVCQGYHNRNELNAEKFTELFKDGKRYFLTGDLAKWDADGNLHIVGRNDRMVKLGGYRIELDEIQNVIVGLPQVKEASVFVTEDSFLLGCVSLHEPKSMQSADKVSALQSEILVALRKQLPKYMIPNRVLILRELPHTPNGKLDNKRLKKIALSGELFGNAMIEEPHKESANADIAVELNERLQAVSMVGHIWEGERQIEAPTTKLQKEILSMWKELLHTELLGVSDDLFEYGANSLKVIEFLALMKQKGRDIVINDVFSNPTVKKLEAFLLNQAENDKLKTPREIEEGIEIELGFTVKILKLPEYVIYFLWELTPDKKENIRRYVSENVDAELFVTHFAKGEYFEDGKALADIERDKMPENIQTEILELQNKCDEDLVWNLKLQCERFEETVLAAEVEKEFRMAAIQNYFLSSERYSGTMIAFHQILDLSTFDEAVTAFLNEQGLFRADIVKHGRTLYWRQRENCKCVNVPFADLSAYTREVQFEKVDEICREIYFREYLQIRDLEGEQQEFTGILYRMLLIKVAENEYYLIIPVNHAIFDAMSGEVVKRRLLELYHQFAKKTTAIYRPQRDYAEFVDQTRLGPVNITEEKLADIFELERYRVALEKLETSIAVFSKKNSTYIRFEMEELDGNNAWSSAFEALRLFARDYLKLSDVPFMVYYYGRKYLENEYFDTVGEFIDMIPMTASVQDTSGVIQEKSQRVIAQSEKYNVNFSALALHQTKRPLEKLWQQVDETVEKTSIVFNFQGKLEDAEMSVFENFLYDRLMQKLNMEEARNIHVMTRYSNNKIQLDINLPFEVQDDSIRSLYENCGLPISGYEQRIVVKKSGRKETKI